MVTPFAIQFFQLLGPVAQTPIFQIRRGELLPVMLAQNIVDSSMILRRTGGAEGQRQFSKSELK
jgi:hypothetical protein